MKHLPNQLVERLSHEWRTPLQGILGVSEWLANRKLPEVHEQTLTLLESVQLLKRSLNYFLLILEFDNEMFSVSRQWVPYRTAARRLEESLQSSFKAAELETTPELQDTTLLIDLPRLLQLIELVAYWQPKAEAASLHFMLHQKTAYWSLKVNPAKKLRAEDRLFIAELARLLEFQWQLEDEQFILTQESPVVLADKQEQQVKRQSATPRILIVDDNPTNRHVVGALLRQIGVEVIDTDEPEEVVRYLKADQEISMILMDIQMPKKDGRELTAELRDAFGNQLPPVVAFTALSLPEDQQEWLDSGLMNDLLPKPVSMMQLRQLLARWHMADKEQTNTLPEEKASDEFSFPDFLNEEALEQLSRYGGLELIRESFREFNREAEKQIQQAWLAAQAQQWNELRNYAHTLKGSAGTLGIELVREIAAEMEHNLRNGKHYEEVFDDFLNLQQAYQQFREWFRSI